MIVARAEPSLRRQAEAIESAMDFGLLYDPASGHLYGGVWTEPPPGCSQPVEALYVTRHRYDVQHRAADGAGACSRR